MYLLLGGSGYIGTAFREYFERNDMRYRCVARRECDYTRLNNLSELIASTRPQFLINCAGYTGKPNVDACELNKADCLAANAVLPGTIRAACEHHRLPWGHVSSGCIYTGSKIDGSGYSESDSPNFCFRTNNCSYYSGTKALGEEMLADCEQVYLWRLRIPFNHIDSPRNYLSKVMRYERLLDATNSISHLDEFVSACVQSWQLRIPFGTYNVTNGGAVTTREVVELIKQHLPIDRDFKFFDSEEQFLQVAAAKARSNCIMDNSKLLATGIPMTNVHQAIARSLLQWHASC